MTMTRREALMTAAAGVALAGTAASAQQEKSPDAPFPKGRYVDIHTHISEGWSVNPTLTAQGLIKWMDENDISQAAVLPLIMPESWDHPITTGFVLRETEPYRDRLIPFCAIDPRTINLGSYEAKLNLLKRYKDAGCRGFGEYKVGLPMDDPRSIELYAACAELGLPILFHLDNSRNKDKPGLPALARVLETVKDGIFIGHAQGWWASISGDVTQTQLQGYPDSPVAPGGALDQLMEAYPNIYGDLSAGSGANAIMRDMEFGREFLIRRQDRLLFGTDYLKPGQQVPQISLYGNIDLPEEAEAKIYRDNARRLLGLL